jgi:hypothetical protein
MVNYNVFSLVMCNQIHFNLFKLVQGQVESLDCRSLLVDYAMRMLEISSCWFGLDALLLQLGLQITHFLKKLACLVQMLLVDPIEACLSLGLLFDHDFLLVVQLNLEVFYLLFFLGQQLVNGWAQ